MLLGALLACLMASIGYLYAEPPVPVLAIKGLDPIALGEGNEIPGLDALETVHGRYRYRFMKPENQRIFESNPEYHGIQFGGACGKMGPFSGDGKPDRFWVHERQIYIFASESCRAGFKKDPESHLERPNPVPVGTAKQQKRGADLVERALVGFGGAERVDSLRTLQQVVTHSYQQGGAETVGTHRVSWSFPARVRVEEVFNSAYGFAIDGNRGFQFAGTTSWPLERTIRDIAWRQALRQPLAMLRQRKEKGFVAVADGPGQVDATPVERLAVALDGATSIWSIEPRSGHILRIEYRARRGIVGNHVIQLGDFRTIDGLVFPHQHQLSFNGKPVTNPRIRLDRIQINHDLEPDLFGPR